MKKKFILGVFIGAMVACIFVITTGGIYFVYGMMLIIPVLAALFHEYY